MKKLEKLLGKLLIVFTILGSISPLALALDQTVPDCGQGYMYVEQVGCVYNGGEESTGGTPNGDNGGTSTAQSYTKSKLFVTTGEADNITLTSATLRGTGGDTVANPTLKITAYFRYSTLPIKPVFCNDVYSANMISTRDIDLGVSRSQTFYQNIYNLQPDTTYYYCAIVSNPEVVAIISSKSLIGSAGAVKQFHTDCLTTTSDTKEATNVKSSGANLNGAYCSTIDVKTSFQYRKAWTGSGTQPAWVKVGETSRSIGTGVNKKSNIYGNYGYIVSALASNTKYEFQSIAENSGKFFYGNILNFTTLPSSGSGTTEGGSGNNGGTGGAGTGVGGGVNTGGGTGGSGGGTGGGVNTGGGSGTGTGVGGGVNTGGGGGGVNTGGTGSGVGTGTWGGGSGSGTWGSGAGSGTWTATKGTGGVGSATWTSSNGICTWISSTGSGTATGCPDGSGTWNHLVLGAHATPPVDAVVRFQEGIETVFTRQIISNNELAKKYGYNGGDMQTFAWDLSDLFARMFGYVTTDRREIRVSLPDVAAYQLVLIGDQLTVYEYYGDTIVDIRNMTTAFKSKAYYEYYFKKQQ